MEKTSVVQVSDEARMEMVQVIVTKATHAYYKSYLDLFLEFTVKRKGKDHTETNFRTWLKVATGKKVGNPKAE